MNRILYVSKNSIHSKIKKYLQKQILLAVPTQNIKKVHNYTNGDQNMRINIQFFAQYKYSLGS